MEALPGLWWDRYPITVLHCGPAKPFGLWERYKLQICDHLPHVLQTRDTCRDSNWEPSSWYGFSWFAHSFYGWLDLPNFELPLPVEIELQIQHNHYDYNPAKEQEAAEACRAQMTSSQQIAMGPLQVVRFSWMGQTVLERLKAIWHHQHTQGI